MYAEKYQATGNDFLLIKEIPENPQQLAKIICDRHFGIGADGLMYPVPSSNATIGMRYFNSDGSEAPMCGNGLRTFVRFVLAHHFVQSSTFTVETKGGIIEVKAEADRVSLDLGLPLLKTNQTVIDHPTLITIREETFKLYLITLGTFHSVIFVESFEGFDFYTTGKFLSTHPQFKAGVNVNFVRIINSKTLEVRTYERGAGPTLSCGTGVAASVYIAHKIKKTDAEMRVYVPGGELFVAVDRTVTLSGSAEKIASLNYLGGE